jgi:hypothetical protein
MNKIQRAEQLRRALQLFVKSLTDDDKIMEVPAVFDEWKSGIQVYADDILTYGLNGVGDPQLYRVVQNHVTNADWTPDKVPALFTAIGIDPDGYPIWAQPTGAHDAYNKGDIVRWEDDGNLYRSTIDGNTWRPDVYGWELYTE